MRATLIDAKLAALEGVDPDGGPEPGRHNFFRGAPLATHEGEAVAAIGALGDEVPRGAVERRGKREEGAPDHAVPRRDIERSSTTSG